jgi:nicotinamidase-related amidase
VVSFLVFALFKITSMGEGVCDVRDGKVTMPASLDQAIKVSLTACVMSSWLHLYYFLMGFDSTGPFMLTIFRIVGRNVPYFLRFYSVIVVTFACGLSLLSNNGTLAASYSFMNILTAMWTLMQVTVGADPTHNSIDIHNDVAPHLYWLGDLLLTMYYASVVILMINLLIAMISHTYEEYISYNAALLLIEKYNIMHAIERSMEAQEYEHYRSLYSHRVKVIIDSLQLAKVSSKASFSRAVSGFVGSAKASSDFAKHVTIESSNYDFELQEVNDKWFSNEQATADAARSKANCKDPAHIVLFLVCPQADFYSGGAHAVDNASQSDGGDRKSKLNRSAQLIAEMIETHGHKITKIVVALASHNYCDLTHAVSWENYQGERPRVGDVISYRSLIDGDWQARSLVSQEWYESYTKQLEGKSHRYLTILPEHCIVGTAGHAVHRDIDRALHHWAARAKGEVEYVHFGGNRRTFMYSAMQAEIEDPLDPSTSLNIGLLNSLLEHDKVCI